MTLYELTDDIDIDRKKKHDIELIVDCSDMPIGDNSNVTIDYDEPEGLDYEIEGTITIEVSRD